MTPIRSYLAYDLINLILLLPFIKLIFIHYKFIPKVFIIIIFLHLLHFKLFNILLLKTFDLTTIKNRNRILCVRICIKHSHIVLNPYTYKEIFSITLTLLYLLYCNNIMQTFKLFQSFLDLYLYLWITKIKGTKSLQLHFMFVLSHSNSIYVAPIAYQHSRLLLLLHVISLLFEICSIADSRLIIVF